MVFDFDVVSALRLDELFGLFFQNCWDIITLDVFAAVKRFFQTDSIPSDLNSNFMILLQKSEDMISIENFWQIILSNFFF